jgi:hypothetical protein
MLLLMTIDQRPTRLGKIDIVLFDREASTTQRIPNLFSTFERWC